MLCDESEEINEIIKMMLEVLSNEKSMIKDVTNTTIVALKQKDEVTSKECKERLDLSISQCKKLKPAIKLKKIHKNCDSNWTS